MTIHPLLRGPRASHNPRGRICGYRPGARLSGFVSITKEGPVLLAPFYRRACLVVVLSVIPASVLAQGASTDDYRRRRRDSSGAVLPGVTIEAASPALIEKVRSTVSDERGEYRLSELRPGNYTVTFTLPGFATFKRDGLELRTNFTARVDAEMTVSQIEETITVSRRRSAG